MANSWILAGALFGMNICLAGPPSFAPAEQILQYLKKHDLPATFDHQTDPVVAAGDADVLYTDVWVSMGCEEEAEERKRVMSPYQVTNSILASAKPDALFMHCMPTHPGEEVSESVLASPQAILFDQAENRLHIEEQSFVNLLNSELIILINPRKSYSLTPEVSTPPCACSTGTPTPKMRKLSPTVPMSDRKRNLTVWKKKPSPPVRPPTARST